MANSNIVSTQESNPNPALYFSTSEASFLVELIELISDMPSTADELAIDKLKVRFDEVEPMAEVIGSFSERVRIFIKDIKAERQANAGVQ